jgi:hypothetical protein
MFLFYFTKNKPEMQYHSPQGSKSSLIGELFYCHYSSIREKVLFIEGYRIGENEFKRKPKIKFYSQIKRGFKNTD